MSILITENSRVIVQGITGREGLFHAAQMLNYGTKVVGGVTPGKGGQTVLDSVPVFSGVREAVAQTGANTSVLFVPPRMALEAILEAVAAGIQLLIVITEGIPTLDMVTAVREARLAGARIIGPNCPGVITPGMGKCGIMPASIHRPGRVGLVSRSGTLTYEAVQSITDAGLGQSTCVGIGGDPVNGSNFSEILEMFEADPQTDGVVMLGEIGGSDEEDAAAYFAAKMTKPVVGFIAGRSAPPGRRMGHAGAIVDGNSGSAAGKIRALEEAGIPVADLPGDVGFLIRKALKKAARS